MVMAKSLLCFLTNTLLWLFCLRWSKIATHFPGRTDNEIKNYWNTRIKKKMKLKGLDPVTHKPILSKSHDLETSSEEMHNHQNLGFQETVSVPSLEDHDQRQHNTRGSLMSNLSREESSCIKNLDMGLGSSFVLQNKESLGNFTMDSYHNFMDTQYFWDCFTGLGDSFPWEKKYKKENYYNCCYCLNWYYNVKLKYLFSLCHSLLILYFLFCVTLIIWPKFWY